MAIIMSCSSSVISNLYESEIPTEDNPRILPSGRKIYRHSTLPGSVLVFDDNFTDCHIVIMDAQYRAHKQYGYMIVNPEDIPPTGRLFDPEIYDMESYPNLSDATIKNLNLWDGYASNLTTKLTTNYPTESFNIPDAALYCKSLNFNDGQYDWTCSLPNITELLRIGLEYKYIDQLDPTITEYPGFSIRALFYDYPNTHNGLIASSFYNNGRCWGLMMAENKEDQLYATGLLPNMQLGTVPIIEMIPN